MHASMHVELLSLGESVSAEPADDARHACMMHADALRVFQPTSATREAEAVLWHAQTPLTPILMALTLTSEWARRQGPEIHRATSR